MFDLLAPENRFESVPNDLIEINYNTKYGPQGEPVSVIFIKDLKISEPSHDEIPEEQLIAILERDQLMAGLKGGIVNRVNI